MYDCGYSRMTKTIEGRRRICDPPSALRKPNSSIQLRRDDQILPIPLPNLWMKADFCFSFATTEREGMCLIWTSILKTAEGRLVCQKDERLAVDKRVRRTNALPRGKQRLRRSRLPVS